MINCALNMKIYQKYTKNMIFMNFKIIILHFCLDSGFYPAGALPRTDNLNCNWRHAIDGLHARGVLTTSMHEPRCLHVRFILTLVYIHHVAAIS